MLRRWQECVRLAEEMRDLCDSLDAGGTAAKMFAVNASFARRGPPLHLAINASYFGIASQWMECAACAPPQHEGNSCAVLKRLC